MTTSARDQVGARPVPALLFVLAAIFFLSGTRAFIYQMVWLRLIGLVFGILGSVANPKGVSARGVALMAKGLVDVRPLLTHHLPLGEFPRAWRLFRDREDGAIRVMLHPASS